MNLQLVCICSVQALGSVREINASLQGNALVRISFRSLMWTCAVREGLWCSQSAAPRLVSGMAALVGSRT